MSTPMRYGVGVDEKRGRVAALGVQALPQQMTLVVEHRHHSFPADVPLARAVDRVADRHVVRGDSFRDRAGCAADMEEPPGDLLPRADFGKGAVLLVVKIDLERLVARAQDIAIHGGNCISKIP
jgi:hypothetical protein